jgi:hypothetical protein
MIHDLFELLITYQPTIHFLIYLWFVQKKIMLRHKKTARRRFSVLLIFSATRL